MDLRIRIVSIFSNGFLKMKFINFYRIKNLLFLDWEIIHIQLLTNKLRNIDNFSFEIKWRKFIHLQLVLIMKEILNMILFNGKIRFYKKSKLNIKFQTKKKLN